MRVTLTGAGGIVGGFVHHALTASGYHVTPLGRETGFHLGDRPDLTGQDALIHCAFAHLPGRYRGGEGEDPEGFRRRNLDGSLRLFKAASQDGVERIIFLSSRAVHDGYPAGTELTDDLPPRPTTLYGEVKAAAEEHLTRLNGANLSTTSLRATGVYGPGPANKWRGLLADYLRGITPPALVATEVLGNDLGRAILTLLTAPQPPLTANLSDLVLDRRDLLQIARDLTGCGTPLPPAADSSSLRVQRCDALRALGWRPSGLDGLRRTMPQLLDPEMQM
jgi:UDP-glucose 4-epimerase